MKLVVLAIKLIPLFLQLGVGITLMFVGATIWGIGKLIELPRGIKNEILGRSS